jgi:hypothetical protein
MVNAGFLTVDDLHTAHDLELATIPRVGRKSLEILYGLMGREMPRIAWVGKNGAPTGASDTIECTISVSMMGTRRSTAS